MLLAYGERTKCGTDELSRIVWGQYVAIDSAGGQVLGWPS
jgi:hypothetical protein